MELGTSEIMGSTEGIENGRGIAEGIQQRLKLLPIRAPVQHGTALLRGDGAPAARQVRQLLDRRFPYAAEARSEVLQLALGWSRKYLSIPDELPNSASADSLVMSGHQPELFHPGVWFKNFVLSNVATLNRQTAINLIIDNDQQKSNWLAFPTVTSKGTVTGRQNFAYGGIGKPYEEREVEDENLFASLPERVADRVADFAELGLLNNFWQLARTAPFENIGYRFSAARHQIEWEMGVHNLELPLSQICQTRSFARFAFEILSDPAGFHEIYNQVLQQYRLINEVSGEDRPVANLEQHGDWFELPFWLWSTDFGYRQKLFAKLGQDGPEICSASYLENDSAGLCLQISCPGDLLDLKPWKIRTRALTTTMYCRSVLSDLFLHGIGGAIYDQLTDEIFSRFFGIQLAPFFTATATFRLQGSKESYEETDLQQAKQKLRDLTWRPEEFVSTGAECESLVAEKKQLISDVPSGPAKRDWQEKLQQVNDQLRQTLSSEIEEQSETAAKISRRLKSQKIENSREWSYLLFEGSLPQQLQELAARSMKETV